MRAFLLSASFWGGSWGFAFSVTNDDGTEVEVQPWETSVYSDTNILRQVRALAATASTNTDSQNIEAILNILNSVYKLQSGVSTLGVMTYATPYQDTLGAWLYRLLAEGNVPSRMPITSNSYVYQIRELLKKLPVNVQSNVFTRADVDRLVSASMVSNAWSSANVLDLMQYLDQIEWHGYNNGMSVDTIRTILLANGADPTIFETAYYDSQRDPTLRIGFGYDAHTFLDGIKSAIVGSVNTGASDIVQAVNALALALATMSGNFDSWVVNQGQSSADVVNYLSAMAFDVATMSAYLDTISRRDYSGQLDSIDSHIVDGNNELQQIREDQLGYGSGESQRDFFWDLMHNELGFSDNRTTAFNMLTQIVQRISYDQAIADAAGTYVTNSLMSVATNGVRDLDKTEEDTLKQIDDYTKDEENQPDWEQQKYTGSNPADELDDVFANGIEAQLDPLLQFGANVEGDTRIELYRGQFPIFGGVSAVTRSSRGPVTVPLDISYSLRDNDEVSLTILTIGTFMEYLWDIVFLALSGWMILRFWDWLASSRGHSSLE